MRQRRSPLKVFPGISEIYLWNKVRVEGVITLLVIILVCWVISLQLTVNRMFMQTASARSTFVDGCTWHGLTNKPKICRRLMSICIVLPCIGLYGKHYQRAFFLDSVGRIQKLRDGTPISCPSTLNRQFINFLSFTAKKLRRTETL